MSDDSESHIMRRIDDLKDSMADLHCKIDSLSAKAVENETIIKGEQGVHQRLTKVEKCCADVEKDATRAKVIIGAIAVFGSATGAKIAKWWASVQ